MKKIEIVKKIILEAGRILKKNFGKAANVTYKQKGIFSIVTETDFKIENFIKNELKKYFPNDSIVGEETETIKGTSKYKWYIDPIDGTLAFSRGIDHCCVMIARIKNFFPDIGFVYNPLKKELFWAEKGRGAFLNDKRLQVSGSNKLNKSVVIASGTQRKKDYVSRLLMATGSLHVFFSTTYSGCMVATGQADAVSRAKVNYDNYAPALLVQEAGGKISNFQGKPWNTKSKTLIFSNGKIHQELVDILKNYKKERST